MELDCSPAIMIGFVHELQMEEEVPQIDVSRKFQELFGVDSPFDEPSAPIPQLQSSSNTIQPASCVSGVVEPISTTCLVERSQKINAPEDGSRSVTGQAGTGQEPATDTSDSPSSIPSNSRSVKCLYCDFIVSRNEAIVLQNHISRCHLQYFPYICTFCGAKENSRFESLSAAQEHVGTQHPGLKVRVIPQLQNDMEILLAKTLKACFLTNAGVVTDNSSTGLVSEGRASANQYPAGQRHQNQFYQYPNASNFLTNPHHASSHSTLSQRDDGQPPPSSSTLKKVKNRSGSSLYYDHAHETAGAGGTAGSCLMCGLFIVGGNQRHNRYVHVVTKHYKKPMVLCPLCPFGHMYKKKVTAHMSIQHAEHPYVHSSEPIDKTTESSQEVYNLLERCFPSALHDDKICIEDVDKKSKTMVNRTNFGANSTIEDRSPPSSILPSTSQYLPKDVVQTATTQTNVPRDVNAHGTPPANIMTNAQSPTVTFYPTPHGLPYYGNLRSFYGTNAPVSAMRHPMMWTRPPVQMGQPQPIQPQPQFNQPPRGPHVPQYPYPRPIQHNTFHVVRPPWEMPTYRSLPPIEQTFSGHHRPLPPPPEQTLSGHRPLPPPPEQTMNPTFQPNSGESLSAVSARARTVYPPVSQPNVVIPARSNNLISVSEAIQDSIPIIPSFKAGNEPTNLFSFLTSDEPAKSSDITLIVPSRRQEAPETDSSSSSSSLFKAFVRKKKKSITVKTLKYLDDNDSEDDEAKTDNDQTRKRKRKTSEDGSYKIEEDFESSSKGTITPPNDGQASNKTQSGLGGSFQIDSNSFHCSWCSKGFEDTASAITHGLNCVKGRRQRSKNILEIKWNPFPLGVEETMHIQ